MSPLAEIADDLSIMSSPLKISLRVFLGKRIISKCMYLDTINTLQYMVKDHNKLGTTIFTFVAFFSVSYFRKLMYLSIN